MQAWYNAEGQGHRSSGQPALIDAGGTKGWFVNGKLHRMDGPAIESANGNKTWLLFGEPYGDEKTYKAARDVLLSLFPELT